MCTNNETVPDRKFVQHRTVFPLSIYTYIDFMYFYRTSRFRVVIKGDRKLIADTRRMCGDRLYMRFVMRQRWLHRIDGYCTLVRHHSPLSLVVIAANILNNLRLTPGKNKTYPKQASWKGGRMCKRVAASGVGTGVALHSTN